MSESFWNSSIDAEPGVITLTMLEEAWAKMEQQSRVVHPSAESPHFCNPHSGICERCGWRAPPEHITEWNQR